jgi:hypothetical protein
LRNSELWWGRSYYRKFQRLQGTPTGLGPYIRITLCRNLRSVGNVSPVEGITNVITSLRLRSRADNVKEIKDKRNIKIKNSMWSPSCLPFRFYVFRFHVTAPTGASVLSTERSYRVGVATLAGLTCSHRATPHT